MQIYCDGEGVPDQSGWSESFKLVSQPPISAVNGGGKNDHGDSRAWWTDFTGPDPRFSASQTDPQCRLELEQGQKQEQEQEQLLVAKLSYATSPQVQIEPPDRHPQIDGGMVKAHAEVVCQVAAEIQGPS